MTLCKKINEARQAEEEIAKQPESLQDEEGPQIVGEARSAMNDVFALQQTDNSLTLEELVSSLNTDQSRIFKHIQQHLQHQNSTKWVRFHRYTKYTSYFVPP